MKNPVQLLILGESIKNLTNIQRIISSKQLPIELHAESNPIQTFTYLKNARRKFPDIIVVDLDMDIMDGLEFAESFWLEFHLAHPETVIYLSGKSFPLLEANEIENNPVIADFLTSPISEKVFNENIIPHLNAMMSRHQMVLN